MRWLTRLTRTLTGSTGDRAVRDELQQHVEMETADLIARGVAPDEARRQALIALGGADRFREEARDTRGVRWLDTLRRDAGYSVRSLRRAPGFTFVVVLTLALGIGANTTFFSILNTLVLKPLPVREPGRLVQIAGGDWTYPIWEQVRERQSHFAEAAFAWSWAYGFDLGNGGVRDNVDGAYVSGDLFRILGVTAARGRVLTSEDDQRGGGRSGPVAVISHRLWHTRFGGADDVIGRQITVSRVPITIVGVLPRSFFGLDVGRSFDVMLPFAVHPVVTGNARSLDRRSSWWVSIGARLRPDQTIEQAQAALRSVQPQVREATIPEDFPPQLVANYLSTPWDLDPAATGASDLRSRYQPVLIAIMSVVGLVLLIACANVANLMLARATTRDREISVRLALGASRTRVAAQLLAESLLLSAAGAAVGLVVALWGSALVVSRLTTWRDTVFLDLSPDWRVVAFLTAVTALTAIVAGLAPAWRTRAASPQDALREGGRGVIGGKGLGVRNALVVSQIALSLVLLVGAGLFLRTFVALSRTSIGMATEALMVVDIDLQRSSAPPEARPALVERMRQAAAGVPGVSSAASTFVTPLSGQGWNAGVATDKFVGREHMTWMNGVSPGWFATVGAPLKEGRDFVAGDGPDDVIVNEAFARRFMDPGPAVGQTIAMDEPGGPPKRLFVIGLSSDVMYRHPREGMVPTVFVSATSQRRAPASLLVRVEPALQAQAGRTMTVELSRLDPGAAFTLRPLRDLADATVAQERLTAGLAVAFGALALVLAAVGLFGVMSYSVNRRRAEIAVRMALGADRATIVRLVIARGTWLIVTGIAVGTTLSWWASRYVQTLLFELDARDPSTLGGAAVVLAIVGAVAAWLPAWRAARIDPAGLLRES